MKDFLFILIICGIVDISSCVDSSKMFCWLCIAFTAWTNLNLPLLRGSQPGFRGTLGFRGPLSRVPRPPSTVTLKLSFQSISSLNIDFLWKDSNNRHFYGYFWWQTLKWWQLWEFLNNFLCIGVLQTKLDWLRGFVYRKRFRNTALKVLRCWDHFEGRRIFLKGCQTVPGSFLSAKIHFERDGIGTMQLFWKDRNTK